MSVLEGTAVAPGIAVGKSLCVDISFSTEFREIAPWELDSELKKLERVVRETKKDIDALLTELEASKNEKEILATHKMILDDPEMIANIKVILSEKLVSLEHALHLNLVSIEKLFSQMDDDYLAARFLDYQDVTQRMIKKLSNPDQIEKDWENKILIAREITPSQVLEAYKKKAAGLISLHGSSKSHTAILARSMMLPYVAETGDKLKELCSSELILDGFSGKIFIEPDPEIRNKYLKTAHEYTLKQAKLALLAEKEAITRDGERIQLMCNMEIPEELSAISKLNIDGIGLFRTEFLYLDRKDLPSEEEQYNIYKKVAEAISPKPLIIRTIDLGGDKVAESLCPSEANPNLGLRGIRLSFKFQDIFSAQIKAILRAALYGNIKIMFPMISSVLQIDKSKELIRKCQNELKAQNIDYKADIPLGTMIEIPSAALRAQEIAATCDFLSIGTNDLVQYTLAVDRNNDLVEDYYNEVDPAVLQLIKLTCEAAHKHNIPVAVCGEMASQPQYTRLLIGLGVHELSTTSASYGIIKEKILELDTKQSKIYAESMLEIQE